MYCRTPLNRAVFCLAWLCFFCLAVLFTPGRAVAKETRIKIFVTTDVHGYVVRNPDRGYIGFAALKGYIDEKKGEGYTTFLLDSGDMFSGSAYAQVDKGKTMARLVSLMGYNAMTPGNHEFDYNVKTGNSLYYADTLLPLVKKKAAHFVATCVNARYRGAPPPNMQTKPFILYDETSINPDGLRIIVAGVITPEFSRHPERKNLVGYDFGLRKGDAHTKRSVLSLLEKALRPFSRPNDIVLVLSHVGFEEKQAKKKLNQLTGRDFATLANVDFVLDGHTHRVVGPERIGDVWYSQGGRFLTRFAELTLKMKKGGSVSRDIELRSFKDTESVQPSAAVNRAIADTRRQYGFGKVLCDLSGAGKDFYSGSNLRWRNRPLGTLFAAAMQKSLDADFAVLTANALKGEVNPTPLTVEHVHNAVPIAGDLMSAKIKGSKVYDLFSRFLVPGTGSFPQFYGIKVHVRQDEDNPRKPYRVLSITLADGKALEPDKVYTVAYNSRLLSTPKVEKEFVQAAHNHGAVVDMVVKCFEKHRKLPWNAMAAEKGLHIQKGQ